MQFPKHSSHIFLKKISTTAPQLVLECIQAFAYLEDRIGEISVLGETYRYIVLQ